MDCMAADAACGSPGEARFVALRFPGPKEPPELRLENNGHNRGSLFKALHFSAGAEIGLNAVIGGGSGRPRRGFVPRNLKRDGDFPRIGTGWNGTSSVDKAH